jgi:hypothetical protein
VGERLVGDELTGALDGESVDGTEVAGILVGCRNGRSNRAGIISRKEEYCL